MSRLMSVAYTEDAVRARTKTVSRRMGWVFLKPGERVTLCRKVMGRKPGEPLERLAEVEIVSVQRVRLCDMDPGDIALEAVDPAKWWDRPLMPQMEISNRVAPVELWVSWFAETMRCRITDPVTRIEWRYLDPRPAVIPGLRRCSS